MEWARESGVAGALRFASRASATAVQKLALVWLGLLSASTHSFAHNPDTSYLRCKVAPHRLELRFTFDPATLYRIVPIDADGDGRVTRAEMEAVAGEIFDYLEEFVHFEINGESARFGQRRPIGWPPDAGEAIAEKDYHQQLLHFTFEAESKPVIEDFYLDYDVFDELGDQHRVISDIEQDGRHHEVIFTLLEPDYVYDTAWVPEPTASAPADPESGPVALAKAARFRSGVARVWDNYLLLLLVAAAVLLAARFPRRGMVIATGASLLVGLLAVFPNWEPIALLGSCAGALLATTLLVPAGLLLPRRSR